MSNKEEIKRLEKNYEQELKRKDKIIEELKKENLVILSSALKRSDKLTLMQEKMKKLMEDNKKYRQKLYKK